MEGNKRSVDLLNDLLAMEISAVNQYFAHSKMCQSWGYERLAAKFRADALDEMKDAEDLIERILFFDGIPNLTATRPAAIGASVPEQLRLHLETERAVVSRLAEGIAACLEDGDPGTREFLAGRLTAEEAHVDWLETQLRLLDQIGETNYLVQQVRA